MNIISAQTVNMKQNGEQYIYKFFLFYEITNRCSYMQSVLFHCQVHCTCFACFIYPSSGVQFLTVSTANGTNHSIISTTYSQCGLVHLQSESSSGIKLTAYSCICWLFQRIYYDAQNHKHKKRKISQLLLFVLCVCVCVCVCVYVYVSNKSQDIYMC